MSDYEKLPHIRIQILERRLEDFTRQWMRDSGWKTTSQTPGSYWMWEKEVEGRLYLVDMETARRIQTHQDSKKYFDEHPDEMGD